MDERERGRRQLPAVETVASDPRLTGLGVAPDPLRTAVRQLVGIERQRLADGGAPRPDVTGWLIAELSETFDATQPRVINATGILIHTNLGRAPVSPDAAAAMAAAASSTVALEVDEATGRRGDRQRRVARLLGALTGCEAALVVNNNAAALLLTVAALAAGRDAIVSRGEAVEIGGGFRVPDVLRQGGARLVEVGTTNRTYGRDYAEACGDSTGILLKVSPSNFTVVGYTHAATVRELAEIGAARAIPVVEDQGNGLLNTPDLAGLDWGHSLADSLADGADIVTASGDKLLGGPQCGLILGRADLLGRVARHPLARAVRVDKVTLAGLEATLGHYLRGEELTAIPLWRTVATPVPELWRRANEIVIGSDGVANANVASSVATFGGGALPGQELESVAIRLRPAGEDTVDAMATRFRRAAPSVWGRVADGCLLLDLRSVLPEDDEAVVTTIRHWTSIGGH